MKTTVTFFISFLLLTTISKSQQQIITVANSDLHGKVKSVTEDVYEGVLKFGDVTKGKKTRHSEERFDKDGFAVTRDYTYYDEDGKKDDGFSQSFSYDKNNRLSAMKEEDDGEFFQYKITNNSEGKAEVIDIESKKGKLMSRLKYKYNSAGKEIEVAEYNSDGALVQKTTTSYNPGNRQEETIVNKDGKIIEVNKKVLDERGNILESINITYKGNKKDEYTRQYKYNQVNKVTEERNSISGLDKKEVFLYDEKGNLVKHVDEYGSIEVHTYTFDKNGNWIKKMSDIKDKFLGDKIEICERSISYY
jgi:hypothetical protein